MFTTLNVTLDLFSLRPCSSRCFRRSFVERHLSKCEIWRVLASFCRGELAHSRLRSRQHRKRKAARSQSFPRPFLFVLPLFLPLSRAIFSRADQVRRGAFRFRFTLTSSRARCPLPQMLNRNTNRVRRSNHSLMSSKQKTVTFPCSERKKFIISLRALRELRNAHYELNWIECALHNHRTFHWPLKVH